MEIPNFARVILDWTLIELKNQMSTFSFSNMLIEPPYLLPSWLYNVVKWKRGSDRWNGEKLSERESSFIIWFVKFGMELNERW